MLSRKCSLDFGMGVFGREKGRKKAAGETGKIRRVSPGLEIPDGEKKERWGLGWIARFPFKEERPEAHSDRRERGSQTPGLEDGVRFSPGQGDFCFRSCLPSLRFFKKQRKSRRRWRRFLESPRRPRCPNPSPPAAAPAQPRPRNLCPLRAGAPACL